MWRHIKPMQVIRRSRRSCWISLYMARYWKHNKIPVAFYSVHVTIPYNSVTRLSAHALCWTYKPFHEANQDIKFSILSIFVVRVFLYRAMQRISHCTKRKPRFVAKSCTYRCRVMQILYCNLKPANDKNNSVKLVVYKTYFVWGFEIRIKAWL